MSGSELGEREPYGEPTAEEIEELSNLLGQLPAAHTRVLTMLVEYLTTTEDEREALHELNKVERVLQTLSALRRIRSDQ